MSGIEQAFKDFVKRVSEQENQEQKSGERGFQYGGGAIGYADGGRINYAGGGSGLPPVEEDQAEQLFGQNIQTPPTGFNFQMNPPNLPTVEPGQEPISIGNFRNFKTMMSNINPQLGYVGDNFGGNVSANMNPFINSPKSYSANAYYGPEQNRLNLGITTIPTAGIKQLSAGYEGPYGNFSLDASRDPMMGKNYTANYNYRFADGGRAGYADGTPMAGLAGKFTPVDPNSPPIPDSLLPTGVTNEISNLVYYGPKNNTIANWKGFSPDNPISPLVPVASPGKVLKPEYQNGIPLGLPMDSYFMDAPITPTQNTTSNLPSDLSIDQIQSLSPRDRIIRALKLAGFSSSDVDSILAKQGFANGGKVNTDLTRTIPPDSGPNPQGVETLFKRRYN